MKLLAGSYDNSVTVDDENALLHSMALRSQRVYQQQHHDCDISYGDPARAVFDWFYSSQKPRGTLVFFHGGYWQSCNKDQFAFIAPAPLLAGFDVVLVEYDLAPAVTLTDIYHQVGRALDAIMKRARGPVYLCGHSAGAHLAALWRHHPSVQAVFAISGIYDLAPLQTTRVNHLLKLTPGQISSLSPARRPIPSSTPIVLYYGEAELPELIAQSQHYGALMRALGEPVSEHAVADVNHFSVLDSLFTDGGAICRQLISFGEKADANHC